MAPEQPSKQAPAHDEDNPSHGNIDENFAMDSLASALPIYRPQQNYLSGERFSPGGPPMFHQQPQMLPFAGQAMSNPSQVPNFPPQFFPTVHHASQSGLNSPQLLAQQRSYPGRSGIPSPLQHPYPSAPYFQSHQRQSPQYMYAPQMYGPPGHQNFQGLHRQVDAGMYSLGVQQRVGVAEGTHGLHLQNPNHLIGSTGGRTGRRPNTTPSPSSIPSAPRGPPRKPKQSGHALWVGNLPPGALVNDLKDHFAREATIDIESVFLISKSNCAFINYRSEPACVAAMARFHDSRFQGVRLVCRLRRNGSSPSPGVPTGPAALTPAPAQSQTAVEAINQNREVSLRAEESIRQIDGATKINDKYFVVKSLTLEDLEVSARNGIWATQAHNEDALNKAYKSVDNVYLIFSANKSGEYYGYARMASDISEEAAAGLDWTPHAEVVADDPDLPRSIPTLATDTAPKGRIIDDSARGTIFWEADILDQNDPQSPIDLVPTSSEDSESKTVSGDEEREELPAGPQVFGKPFKIEWVTTNRLPFFRTRGLRNPWNANREVKIARDGTELETSVGRRLVQMFHRTAPNPGAQLPMSPGIQMPMGYPNARQF